MYNYSLRPLISKISSKDIPPKALQVAFFVLEPPRSDSQNQAGSNTYQLHLAGLLDFLSYSPCITSHGAGSAESPAGWCVATLTRRALCSATGSGWVQSFLSTSLRISISDGSIQRPKYREHILSVTRCQDWGS